MSQLNMTAPPSNLAMVVTPVISCTKKAVGIRNSEGSQSEALAIDTVEQGIGTANCISQSEAPANAQGVHDRSESGCSTQQPIHESDEELS